MKVKTIAMLAMYTILLCLSGCRESNNELEEAPVANNNTSMSKFVTDDTPYTPELREEFEKDGIDIDKIEIQYFLDDHQVDPIDNIEDRFPVASLIKNEVEHSALITVKMFSTEEKYLQYGDQNGLKFRESKFFDEAIQKYAIQNGLVQLETTGADLPDSYYAFEKQQYVTYFGAVHPGWLQVFDDIVPYGSNKYIMSPFMPSLSPPWPFSGWNNKIGCYKRLHTYTVEHLYDKTFFRKRLVTLSGWGTSTVLFWGILGYCNNKVESMLLF